MKRITYCLIAAALFIFGCGHDPALIATDDPPTRRADDKSAKQTGGELKEASQPVVWQPSMIVGGEMFQDAQEFGEYVRRAQFVATGVMTEWDGSRGQVRLDSVFHGKLKGESVPVVYDGGWIRPQVGERVLFLLRPRDRELKLHAHCSASGIYNYSDDLALVIKNSLESAE